MDVKTLWRVLVTLVCAGAILALPQGSTVIGRLAGPAASASESWFEVGDQTPGLISFEDGSGLGVGYSSNGLIAEK